MRITSFHRNNTFVYIENIILQSNPSDKRALAGSAPEAAQGASETRTKRPRDPPKRAMFSVKRVSAMVIDWI